MPTYDYQCRNCGHRVEVLHGVNAPGPTACDQCGGPMRKLLSLPAIVFRGTGWAKKDARESRPTAKAGAGAAADKSDGAASSASSDSGAQPDSKSDSTKKATTNSTSATASD